MKQRTIFAHLSIPIIFSLAVFLYALSKGSFSVEMVPSVLVGGFLFYVAPYLLWVLVILIGKPSNVVAHCGFIASTIALALIACFWFFPPEPSGLPMQWMLYWPLAIILIIVFTSGALVYVRTKAPNKAN